MLKCVLFALISLISTITWVDRNGRVMNNRNRSRHYRKEKSKPIGAHRLEDDAVTARTKEMQKSRGYVSDAEKEAEAVQSKTKSKARDSELPEAKACPGLFGMKFGEVFDPKSQDPISPGEYAFSPDEQFRSYTVYSVRTLPVSKRIYEIRAKAESSLDKAERDVVLALLEKKFGTTARGNSIRFRGEKGAADGRTVSVSSSGIVATDLALKKQVKSESKEAAAEAAEASSDDLRAL